jgi:ribonucleoside-triphosphate reductase
MIPTIKDINIQFNTLMDITVIKRDGKREAFNPDKLKHCIKSSFRSAHARYKNEVYEGIISAIDDVNQRRITVETIQDIIERYLMSNGYEDVAKHYILYRKEHERIREWVNTKKAFIEAYKRAYNTADATVDDNSNMSNKNIGVMNNEIHKPDNMQISRRMVIDKLTELFPEFDSKQYLHDLNDHIIYKHDESSFAGAVAPYCVSLTMYPFLIHGLKYIGGLSAAPKNLDSYCGMYINLIFAVSAQFAGAVATSEFLLYFDYFARKEWGDDYYTHPDECISAPVCKRQMTIQKQIEQYFQQVVYSINQPAAARGLQSAFVNFSYFDKPFFEGMFGDFYFPDCTAPKWESLCWLQKTFMRWFNKERTRCIMTFPVESFALVYQDGHFLDQDSADFVAEEYAAGHSFFTYMSDTVDSLSSCCRLKNMVTTKEFSFTNGNMGVQTGSKSVITLNLNRIIQDCDRAYGLQRNGGWKENTAVISQYLEHVLEPVYKYHTAYNELLWDMKDAHLLPVYDAGFIDLNKQYLTNGLNGLNQAAEYLGIRCDDNEDYQRFCQLIFGTISGCNKRHNGTFNGHTLTFNTEQVPAESLAVKNYNWDKEDGYWVPEDTNLYASYIFKPNDENVSLLKKIKMHGRGYIGDYLDGGAAAHLNLSEHLTKSQYNYILDYAAKVGCNYLTFNVPNCECNSCGHIEKHPFSTCPVCGSENVSLYDRIIGYLTKISNWSEGRRIEQKTRVYEDDVL